MGHNASNKISLSGCHDCAESGNSAMAPADRMSVKADDRVDRNWIARGIIKPESEITPADNFHFHDICSWAVM